MLERLQVPVAMFLFKRKDTTLRIIDRIAEVKPPRIYLIADAGRNDEERQLVEECRKAVEERISWDCEIVKHYAQENRGVYRNIGEGAKWVFEREERAIFLEDDNLPEVSFFYYCQEMLEKYAEHPQVLWVCGTNYLGKYEAQDGASYMFTKHLLPCGWASWSNKFLKYYDGELKTFNEESAKKLAANYENKALYKYQLQLIEKTAYKLEHDIGRSSWDYQMAYSVRANNMYGISPCNNQIKNIGVDELSTHGGTMLSITMTERFCGMESYPLQFPLKHPDKVACDPEYEKIIGKIILPPWRNRAKLQVGYLIKRVMGIDRNASLKEVLAKRKGK